MLTRLSQHLLTICKNRDEITRLAALPLKACDIELKKLRCQHIFNYNKQQLQYAETQLLRERQRQHDSELMLPLAAGDL